MTQEPADRDDVPGTLHELGGKVMPTAVRRGRRVDARGLAELLEDLLNQADADAAVLADDQERGIGCSGEPARLDKGKQACDRLAGGLVERDAAGPVAFGVLAGQEEHLAGLAFGGDVPDVERDQLADAEARVREQLDEPVVSFAEGGAAVDRLQE